MAEERGVSRRMLVWLWVAATALAAPASWFLMRGGLGMEVGVVACVPGALAAGALWGLALWPWWRLGRRGFLAFVAGAGALHAFVCAGALALGWGRQVRWGATWTLGALFEFYAVLVFVLFAAVVGGLRVAGERRVCRALWLRPLVLAGAVALGGVTGAGIAYGLLGFSESRLRALTTANGAYLKATGEWAPSLEGLTPQYIPKIPMPPWYLADHRRVQYGHLPGSTHYWLNWGGWQVCQSVPVGGGAVETEVFRYAPAEYGHGHSAEGLR